MPIRIGLDVRLTYYTTGGIARYIRHLAAWLPRIDSAHEYVYLYHRGHAENLSPQARRADCWTPAHYRLESFTLALEVLPLHLDLLHSPDFIPPLGGSRRPVITVHDLAFLRYPEFLTPASRRYYNAQIQRAVRQARAIISVSQATKEDLVRELAVPPEKITVIHHGRDEAFRPLSAEAVAPALARLGLTPGYVLFVGTFEPRKNVLGLLAAYARLRQRLPEAPPLVLAGGQGWLFEPTAARVHALGLESQVHFIQNFAAADAPALYNGASTFVLPSHYEGFGIPVLEAMSCGIPTIISDRPSLLEVAGEAALKIDPDAPEALAEALYRVLTDAGLQTSLRQRGLEQSQGFSWTQAAQATLEVYNRVLST
jgi:glycosyltransferase involved in cell wall biosynthesis